MREFAPRNIITTRKDQYIGYSLDVPQLHRTASTQVEKTGDVLKTIDTTLAMDQQFAHVSRLQDRWDSALGSTTSEETKLASNYNPVLARWNFERMEDQMQRDDFRKNELKNIETALRERNQTVESKLTFTFDKQGKVRNEMFPDEPYENMLERGKIYREKHGSNELVREQAEIDGFQKIQNTFSNAETPVGTTYVMISPPSQVEESIYTHNFVDVYELAKDEKTGEKVINYTRFASSLDYDQYAEVVKGVDSTYSIKKALKEEEHGQPIPDDAWYLAHPLQVTEGALTKFEKDVKAMEEKEWQELWKLYAPFALHLLDTLTKDNFDPIAIAKAYNTLLHSGENEELIKQMKEKTIFSKSDIESQVSDMVSQFGRKKVEEKAVGCGSSGGVDVGGGSIIGGSLANSVAQFGTPGGSGNEQETFSCPECPYVASKGVKVGNRCPRCGLTKEAFAEKNSGKSCD